VRQIAAGASYAGAQGAALIERLYPSYATISDAYGTNSHFCLSVLNYVESLVLAHTDLAFARANVLDLSQSKMLGSGFAF
jgi:hypothetical protein